MMFSVRKNKTKCSRKNYWKLLPANRPLCDDRFLSSGVVNLNRSSNIYNPVTSMFVVGPKKAAILPIALITVFCDIPVVHISYVYLIIYKL
jgi:hypothetical protein